MKKNFQFFPMNKNISGLNDKLISFFILLVISLIAEFILSSYSTGIKNYYIENEFKPMIVSDEISMVKANENTQEQNYEAFLPVGGHSIQQLKNKFLQFKNKI